MKLFAVSRFTQNLAYSRLAACSAWTLRSARIFRLAANSGVRIRIALGSDRSRLARLVLVDASYPLLSGILLGLLGAAVASRSVSSFLYQTSARSLDDWVESVGPPRSCLVGVFAPGAQSRIRH